ncbi:Rieske 2Fe-2S domain-containing protein [Bacillus sp. S34]|nr:Rieske 2Fe-2S domain-containing protein [Bacillus sp. S34]
MVQNIGAAKSGDWERVEADVRAVVDGTAVAIVKDSAGTVHAIGDTCTHGDISLAEGFVEGDTLE